MTATATGLRPPKILQVTNTRERILMMGGAGMGKTYAYLCIARLALLTGSDAIFYIVDTDETATRMLVDPAFRMLWNDEMSELKNIVIRNVSSWEGLLSTLDEIQGHLEEGKFVTKGLMRDQDWLMIDMLTPTWGWVVDWFSRRIFAKGIDEFFLQAREKMKPGAKKMDGLEGWADYGVINPAYAVLQDRILRTPGNIYCTAEVKPLGAQADKETRLQFGPYGVVPAGQKRTPHVFATILWATQPTPGQREIISIKDRSRPLLEGAPIQDFAVDYLCDVAEWVIEAPKPKVSPAEALAKARAAKEQAAAA